MNLYPQAYILNYYQQKVEILNPSADSHKQTAFYSPLY